LIPIWEIVVISMELGYVIGFAVGWSRKKD